MASSGADLLTAGARPEPALLLCCARTSPDVAAVEQIDVLLHEDIDWAALRRLAAEHSVTPLLYQTLYTTYPEAVPDAVLNQLRVDFHTNALRNNFLAQELLKLLAVFKTESIPALPYKGPVLAASAYGRLALRQFVDLDILVRPQDVARIIELLAASGYRLHLTENQKVAYTRHHYDLPLVREDERVKLELHWAFAERLWSFPLDFEQLWRRREPVSLAGTRLPDFPPEEMLLILSLHGAKHGWSRLMWLCDVAEQIRAHCALDWDRVLEMAGRLGSRRLLFINLFLAGDLLGAGVPEEVRREMQADPAARSLARQVSDQFLAGAGPSWRWLDRRLFPFRLRERWRDRAAYALHLVRYRAAPTRKDQSMATLPPFLSFLYYPLRLIRIVKKYGLKD